jgi:hypothetical protein
MPALSDLRIPSVERRTLEFEDFDLREEGGELRFDGIAAVTGKWTELFPGMRERIAKGAFRKALSGSHDVRLLVDHDSSKVLARSTKKDGPGSLKLNEEARGLRARAVFSDTTVARDTATLLRDEVVNQMSFAWPYGATRDTIEETEAGDLERTINEFKELRDVSVVTYPAYPTTSASMRSLEYGADLDVEELRRLATDVHNGHVVVTDEERRLIDEAFAARELLSPWMEELARRVIGSTDARTADQGAEDDDSAEAAVGGPTLVSAAARKRRLSLRSKQLPGGTL